MFQFETDLHIQKLMLFDCTLSLCIDLLGMGLLGAILWDGACMWSGGGQYAIEGYQKLDD